MPVRAFFVQAVAPSLPGLLAAAVVTAALERWHAPTTLGAIFAHCVAASAAFVVAFAPFGLRGLRPARTAGSVTSIQEVAVR